MNKKLLIQLIFFFLILVIYPLINRVHAAKLLFEPININTQAGQTFQVKVNVDAGSEEITSVDAYVLYNKDILEIQEISAGDFFPTVSKETSLPGKAYIAGLLEDPSTSKTGSGILATITFKAKTNGSVTLTFDCTTGSTTDSNITKNDVNATDIIQCDQNGQATVNVGEGGSNNNSQSNNNSSSSTTNSSSNPSQLPRSGVFDNLLKYFVPGVILLLIGALTKALVKI